MDATIRTSRAAVSALLMGVLSLVCGVLAVLTRFDQFLIGVVIFGVLALVLGIRGWMAVNRSPAVFRGKSLAGWGMVGSVGGFAIGFLVLPAAWRVRDAAVRLTSANNLYQIGLAMHGYAAAHDGRLPPAVRRDSQGKPLLSWRVLILPFLDQDPLYRQFHLDESWDSPHNITLLSSMPRFYSTTNALTLEERAEPPFSTFYQVFTGDGTAFEGEGPQGLSLGQDFPRGTSDTFLVVEAGQAVPWTKPEDLTYQYDWSKPLPPLGGVFTGESRFSLFGSNRVKGFYAAMADGSQRFFHLPTDDATLRNAIERKDAEPLGEW